MSGRSGRVVGDGACRWAMMSTSLWRLPGQGAASLPRYLHQRVVGTVRCAGDCATWPANLFVRPTRWPIFLPTPHTYVWVSGFSFILMQHALLYGSITCRQCICYSLVAKPTSRTLPHLRLVKLPLSEVRASLGLRNPFDHWVDMNCLSESRHRKADHDV